MVTDASPEARRARLRLVGISIPGPGVAEPGGGQHVDGLVVRALVGELDGHQQVVRAGLGVVHLGDPVPVPVKRAGVDQLVLGLVTVPAGVGIDQVLIRERALRVVVTPPVPGVARDGVQVPPVLLDVLAVVALRPGQPEGALLQDRVAPVPQGQGQAQPLVDVAEPGQAILSPPVGPGPRLVVRQVVPGVAVGAVVLPHRAPLPLADVRPPPVPLPGLQQPVLELSEFGYPVTLGAHRAPSLFRGHPSAFIGTSGKQIDHPKGVITPVIDSKGHHMASWWPDWHLLWPRSRAVDLGYGRRPG